MLTIVEYLNSIRDTAPRAEAVIGLARARAHIEITRTAAARLAHAAAALSRSVADTRYGACRVTAGMALEEVEFATDQACAVPELVAEFCPEIVAANAEVSEILSEIAHAVVSAAGAVAVIIAADAAHMSAVSALRGAAPSEREEAQATLDLAAAALEAARETARPLVDAHLDRVRETILPLAAAAESLVPGAGSFFSSQPSDDRVATCRALDALYLSESRTTLEACRALAERLAT